MAVPAEVFSFPISFKASTVILTEVAVKITPINIFCNKTFVVASFIKSRSLNRYATKNPPINGINTPNKAIIKDAFPVFLSSFKSVSRPAENINKITPSSDNCIIKFVSFKILSIAGPKINPANNAPTT